jgi:hypothetical protein
MSKNAKVIIAVLVLIVIGVGAFAMLNQPDNRDFGQKVEDAAGRLDEGVDDAAREFEDRTPLERIEDGYEDATDGNAE